MAGHTNAPMPSATLDRESWLRSFMDHINQSTRLKNDGSNFTDLEAALRNAAVADGKLRYLTEPEPPAPGPGASANEVLAHKDFIMEAGALKNVLIFAMEANLQRRFIAQGANKIFTTLTNDFSQAPRIVKYDCDVRFFEAKLQKGQAVSPHILNMIENVEKLEALQCKINEDIVVDRILHSLHDGFNQFRANYYMNDMHKSLHEIHSLLVQTEKDLNLSGSTKRDVLLIKHKGKGKGKAPSDLHVKPPSFKRTGKPPTKSGPGETSSSRGKIKSKGNDFKCHHCDKIGHMRRNCTKYKEDIKAGSVVPVGMSSSFIHMIEIYQASFGTWVFDTGCGSHLCNHLQGLRDV